MSRYVIHLSNEQLARVSPVFLGIHRGWTQRVEVIYTEGEADTPGDGVTLAATARAQFKHLNGIVAINLAVCKTPNLDLKLPPLTLMDDTRGEIKISETKPTLKEMRETLFRTLTHELLHVLQGWVWGEQWERRYNEARSDALSKDIFGSFRRVMRGEEPYLGYHNRYEIAAYNFGVSWVSGHRAQLAAGDYDDIIPIADLKAGL